MPGTVREPYASVFLRGLLWLLVLAPLFYATYGFANWYASQQPDVGAIVFDWERSIPFMAWTIVPYWSINLFYGLSLALNATKRDVDRLAFRYLTAQFVAVTCFIAFPLQATFVRPPTDGLPGFMFDVLADFDKPFNQAPSLHIALLVIIWDHWRRKLSGLAALVCNVWAFLIGASVLTTWQHHFIDIPTGALLGLVALWLFPAKGLLPLSGYARPREAKARRLARTYALGALACLAGAVYGAFSAPGWLMLLWPASALAIVALGYAGFGAKVFQKDMNGRVSLAARLLLMPYTIAARINAWAWTRGLEPHIAIADGVHLGSFPRSGDLRRFATVVDLTAEFARPAGVRSAWLSVPMLDLVGEPRLRDEAAAAVETARAAGPVLVCCALGIQRSAGVVARWLVATGRVRTEAEAQSLLAGKGRPVRFDGDPSHEAAR